MINQEVDLRLEITGWMLHLGLVAGQAQALIEKIPQWFCDEKGYEFPRECPASEWLAHLSVITKWFDAKRKIMGDDWIIKTPEAAFIYAVKNGVNISKERENITMVIKQQKQDKIRTRTNCNEDYNYEYSEQEREEFSREADRLVGKVDAIVSILNEMTVDEKRKTVFQIYDKFCGGIDQREFIKTMYRYQIKQNPGREDIPGMMLISNRADEIKVFLSGLSGVN